MQEHDIPLRDIPSISYPEDLPVARLRGEIARAIVGHQVVVVAGETGSGKTTQLPKICLELGRGRVQRIGHTQPRRLAARNVAQRIAEELRTSPGELVGYQVRFQDTIGESTAVKLMTDGILLGELQRDRQLTHYDTLIVDEAHERSLNIDFILGYLKQLLPRRPDLKLIITSATIDVERFAAHFDDAPIIQVPGRSFPVETHYIERPVDQLNERERQDDIVEQLRLVRDGYYGRRGDILVFLPGEREIRELARALRGEPGLETLPLYARLGQAEQARVFNPGKQAGLRVVLATNVAETSLTVPGIRYVIDPGDARISRYSARSRIQRLPVEPVSRASADQRRGRCGRVAAGVCLRLYSEQDYLQRPEYTDPEILRTNLAAVILQMLYLRLGEVQDFPFIEPPDPRMVREGYRLLHELGAVDRRNRLTGLGKQLARLPVDPLLGCMILAARSDNVVAEVLVIASALAIQDPRERPAEKQQQADQAHARFRHPRSDFLAWLNLWRYYEEQRQRLSQNQLRKLCQREFLSFMRMREWRDTHRQLSIACRQQGIAVPPLAEVTPEPAAQGDSKAAADAVTRAARAANAAVDYAGVHRALLAGLLANIAQRDEGRVYRAARNRKVQLFPGSVLNARPAPWLVAAEVVETSKVYARTSAAIEPSWLLHINPQLLKKHHYEPRWQKAQGRAVATERVTLFGLTISDGKSVHYGPIDAGVARELMLREGLVAGRWRSPPHFLRHNLALVEEIADLEARTRRRDILADEEAIFRFYDAHIPRDIFTAAALLRWIKRDPGADSRLRVSRDLLLANDPGTGVADLFPDQIVWESVAYPLSYEFDPGGERDGVSVTVPVALMNRVPRHRFEWLVPGLLREKCIALLRALPKATRKHFVPAPDVVDSVLPQLAVDDTPLQEALAAVLSRRGGPKVAAADWAPDCLEPFYHANIKVVDERGRVLGEGRDLSSLVARFRDQTAQEVAAVGATGPRRSGLRRWDFEDLPAQWHFTRAGMQLVAYPALVDAGDSVAVRLFDYADEAWLSHRLGLARLLQLQLARPVKQLRKQLLRGNEYQLMLAAAGLQREAVLEDIIAAIVLSACGQWHAECRSREAFTDALSKGNHHLVSVAQEFERTLSSTLKPLAALRPILTRHAATWPQTAHDVERQLADLLRPGFAVETAPDTLAQFPRYMKAISVRLDRLPAQPQKDAQCQALLAALEQPLDAAREQHRALLVCNREALRYWVMLQEFRVSLFAQNLGTSQPVSEKRLKRQWQLVEESTGG